MSKDALPEFCGPESDAKVTEFVRVKLQEEYSAEREAHEIFSTEEFPEFSDWLIQKGIHPENIHGITNEGKDMVKKFINEWVVASMQSS